MNAPREQAAGRRWWLWLPALAISGWLALFGDRSVTSGAAVSLPTRVVPAPPRANTAAAVAAPAHSASAERLAALVPREQLFPQVGGHAAPASRDPFSARSWNPPSPPPSFGPAPPPPVAPALPYAFMGRKQEAGEWEVYLLRGEQTFVARPGEVLEGQYRVDAIQPPVLTLTYLPLGQAQTLFIGDTR